MRDLAELWQAEIERRRVALDERQRVAEHARDRTPPGAVPWDGRWRTGRRVGRTVYALKSEGPDDADPLIGCMDAADFSEHVAANDPATVLVDVAQQRAMLDGYAKLLSLHAANACGECRTCMYGVGAYDEPDRPMWPCVTALFVQVALGVAQ